MFLLRYSVIDGIYAISSIRENKRLRFLLVYINDEIDRCGNCSHVLKETFKINMKTDCQVIVRVSVKNKIKWLGTNPQSDFWLNLSSIRYI